MHDDDMIDPATRHAFEDHDDATIGWCVKCGDSFESPIHTDWILADAPNCDACVR